jgi:type IV secretory pathway component VirB8
MKKQIKKISEFIKKDINKDEKREYKLDKSTLEKRKEELMKGIANNKQSMWIWIVLVILTCWTIIGAIVFGILAMISHDMKTKKEIELSKYK